MRFQVGTRYDLQAGMVVVFGLALVFAAGALFIPIEQVPIVVEGQALEIENASHAAFVGSLRLCMGAVAAGLGLLGCLLYRWAFRPKLMR